MSATHITSSQAFFQPTLSLPQQHLTAIQHIINDALALQSRAARPPPPYNTQHSEPLWFKPRMDLFESPSVSGAPPLVTATFELPGLRKEDVRIDVLDNQMIVAGERRHLSPSMERSRSDDELKDVEMAKDNNEQEVSTSSTPEARERYTVREIKRGRFKRVVPLPVGTKLEDVRASLLDGILTVTFPGLPRPVPHNVPVA